MCIFPTILADFRPLLTMPAPLKMAISQSETGRRLTALAAHLADLVESATKTVSWMAAPTRVYSSTTAEPVLSAAAQVRQRAAAAVLVRQATAAMPCWALAASLAQGPDQPARVAIRIKPETQSAAAAALMSRSPMSEPWEILGFLGKS